MIELYELNPHKMTTPFALASNLFVLFVYKNFQSCKQCIYHQSTNKFINPTFLAFLKILFAAVMSFVYTELFVCQHR